MLTLFSRSSLLIIFLGTSLNSFLTLKSSIAARRFLLSINYSFTDKEDNPKPGEVTDSASTKTDVNNLTQPKRAGAEVTDKR
jgi:hypothetical protein